MKFQYSARLVRHLMIQHKITNAHIERSTGIKAQFISSMRIGKVRIPPIQAKKIAKVLNTTVEKIAGAVSKDYEQSYIKEAK